MRTSACRERALAERALTALDWRGPDGSVLLDVGPFRLGVARLAITDPSAPQPIVCPRTGRAVALNGAITSAARDRERFRGRAATRNDAELLLLRLEDGGERALLDVTGPYAFAIVDPRTGALWLGRDPEGEKPLLVALDDSDRVVAFASTATALATLGFDTTPAAETAATFLRYGFAPPRFAATRPRVVALPPGLFRDLGDGLERVDVPTAVATPTDTPVDRALRHAVERCSTAEVPLGLALSGGVDSACLAACLRELDRTLPCYQARATTAPDDERQRARRVAEHLGHPLVEVDFDATVLRELPRLTRLCGQPLGDPSVLAVHALARRAAQDGVRVLLSGEGADELLLGYDRHRAAAHLPRRGLRGLPAPGLSRTRFARLLRALAARRPYDALLEVAPPAFRRRAFALPDASLTDLVDDEARRDTLLDTARLVDRHAYLRFDLLPKLDTATMAAGVEGRCPFLDPEVLHSREAREPDARRILGKRALRAAFAPLLPPGHFDQRKRGFAVPIDRWLREDAFLPDLLLERRTLERPHLRAKGVPALLDLHRSRRADLGHPLYLIAAWELHLRTLEGA